jgi:hypothetical protein
MSFLIPLSKKSTTISLANCFDSSPNVPDHYFLIKLPSFTMCSMKQGMKFLISSPKNSTTIRQLFDSALNVAHQGCENSG